MATIRSYKVQKFLERLPQKLSRPVVTSLVACVHCGLCTESCHYVLANPGDVTYAPAYKADQIRKIFKRHIDWTGRVLPGWVGARSVFTDEELEELKDIAFGKCTNCRRCSLKCPMGVDFAVLNRVTRGLLVHVGVMPEGVAVVSKDQWEIGNLMGVLKEDYLETLEWMSEELVEEVGDPAAAIPIDKKDADVVYAINPREVKYDPRTIKDAAKIFYYAGENWTMPSEGWDMTNFGLFSGDDELGGAVARRLFEKVQELRGKKLVISECGRGYRSTRCEGPNWAGMDIPFEMESSVVTMLRYAQQGRIRLDRRKNAISATYHDSCNNARSCGMFEEPRELLRQVVTEFREMYPNRAENFCCTGGGGAMSMSEYAPRRLKSAKVKADQLAATGAQVVVTSCHNCVDGLNDLIRHYGLPMKVTQLVNLVSEALAPAERKTRVHVRHAPVPAFAGHTILVADDEPDTLIFLTAWLEDQGFRALGLTDPLQVLEVVRAERPHLVVLDVHMPCRSGVEVYRTLVREEGEKRPLVVFLTGGGEFELFDRNCHPLPPPEGILEKPVDLNRLGSWLSRVLEDRSKP
ncbi:MAG: response regulator [Acidobacteriota bacterium]